MTGPDPRTAAYVATAIAEELVEPLYRLGPWRHVTSSPDVALLQDDAGRFEVLVRRVAAPSH
ncbi:hypothetical protein [Actinomycetospora soli]|uniref:hypothetical protein n=1 Tax=Actinomycetospora soli TaxID=2893887 RepID=UPI001E59D416|nr:hypothetical protein [Actinomycetospora soli]MCD2191653.1 hypothetical protein [Actinomycetospora soli]